MVRIASLLGLLTALVGCGEPSSAAAVSLSGVWNLAAPNAWSTFRLTLTQTGNAASGAALIEGGPLFNGSYTIAGTAAVDTFALNLDPFSDGSQLHLYGRVIVAGSLRGTLVFTDVNGVDHLVSPYGILDQLPTEMHFNK